MLKLNNVSLSFDIPIINNVSFELSRGEFLGIVGESGEGKTTLLKIISGLLNSSDGEVLFDGHKVDGPSMKLIPGHEDIKLVNQDFDLDLYHTVRENVKEKILFLIKEDRETKVDELLGLMELNLIQHQKAINLSGGEQQRLAFARALASEPRVLLLDEPFAHLDFRLKNKIQDYLLNLKFEKRLSVIIVSHNGEEILSVSDRIIHFKRGAIERIDTPFNFYKKPESKNEALLFGPVNEILVEDKTVLFRPNSYSINNKSDSKEVSVKFISDQFCGAYYMNFFYHKNQKIVLYAEGSMREVNKIYLKN